MAVRRAGSLVVLGVLVLAGFTACSSAAMVERERLAQALGRDPVAVLRAIGSARDPQQAYELARDLEGVWSGAETLRLLRFGLAHDDERVVFGATVLMEEWLPVPELRHAAAVVLPRLGDSDCPVSTDRALQLVGSGDLAAAVRVLPKLSEADGYWFLGNLHRMVRSDGIPLLCELARSSTGAVRRAAFADAVLAAEYDDRHVPLLVATWLDLVGRARDPDPVGTGLPGVLTAALRAHLEVPEPPPPASGAVDRRSPALPIVPCARWLAASSASAADVPLLRRLLECSAEPLHSAAAWSLGGVDDQAARSLFCGEPVGVSDLEWTAAKARGGDLTALESLLSGYDAARALGLALAAPARRRVWLDEVSRFWIGAWARGQVATPFTTPPFDDGYFVDLEPMLASASRVDTERLCEAVRDVPACQTGRLGDRLLQCPTAELFADDERDFSAYRALGRGGCWSFLEVTRPEAFRRRLHEGLDSEVPPIRDRCAELLVRLGDRDRCEDLAAWLDEHDEVDDGWLDLARDGGPAVVAALHRRVAEQPDARSAVDRMRGLAVALGMPRDLAARWEIAEERAAAVREALLAGDPAAAFLRSDPDLPGETAALLAGWQAPGLREWARERRSAMASADEVYRFDQVWALASGDQAELERMLGPVRDGRYAAHHGFSAYVAARAVGLAMLPFWIDELGSNCCRVAVVEDVLRELFGRDSDAFERSRHLEPACVFLRRTLLPVADRLCWSRIANGYVVAGN